MRHFLSLSTGLAFLLNAFLSTPGVAAPPVVALTAPADGALWEATPTLAASANATDADGTIIKVEFHLDGTLLGTSFAPVVGTLGTFNVALAPRPAAFGASSLTARAYDNSGEMTTSAPRTLNIAPPAPPPTVATGGATFPYSSTYAALSGTVNPHGVYTFFHFEFGFSASYGGVTEPSTAGARHETQAAEYVDPVPVGGFIDRLERGTTYHYRLVAGNSQGTSYGGDATFTTPLNFPPTALDAFANVRGTEAAPVFCDFEDRDGEPVTITAVSIPSHGTVTIGSTEPGGDLTYAPDGTFEVEDEFTYTVSDQHGGTAMATVRMIKVSRAAVGQYVSTIVTYGGLRPVGAVGVNVTATRIFTGVLNLFGVRYALRGRFSLDGYASLEIDRAGAPPITLNLALYPGPQGARFTGAMQASGGDYEISDSTALIFPEAAPEAGSYTMALPPGDPAVPLGNGYITGRVGTHGRVVFAGRIGDGQAFSFGTHLRRGGTAQIFVTAGSEPRDRIHGEVQFPDAGASECTGELRWGKAARTTGYYQAGFQTLVQVTGSRLVLSTEEETILDYSTGLAGLDIVFSDLEGNELLDGSFSGPDEESLTFDESSPLFAGNARSRAAAPRPEPTVTISVNRQEGTFSGRFRVPGETGEPRKFSGVLLQHQNAGAGLLRFGKRTGSVTLTPR